MVNLDATDIRILNAIQAKGRLSNTELARRINLSESACLRRVKRLEEEGVIEAYVALLNQERIGRAMNAFVELRLSVQNDETLLAFETAVGECDDVMACYFMTGDADYLLHIPVTDLAHYEEIYRSHLSRFPHVASIRTSFALRTVVKKTAFKLRGAG